MMQGCVQDESLRHHFAEAISFIDRWAPGLYFGSKDRFSISIEIDKPVRWIRIGLSAELPLHLPQLAVYQDDRQINVDASKVIASSHYDHRGEDLSQLNLRRAKDMLSSAASVGMHTETEAQPWIEVDLGEVMNGICIRLWNRIDEWAWRNWKLTVVGSVDAVRWSRYHDHVELADNVEMLLRNARLNTEDQLASSVYAFIGEACFSFLKMGAVDGDKLFALTEKLKLPWHQCVDNINELFFRRFAREIGIHGLRRTFLYWEDAEKADYLNAMNNIIANIQELTPAVCLGYGGVLSYVRNGELIPHDDDLDVIVVLDSEQYPTIPLALARVEQFMKDRGFELSGDFVSHRWVKIGENFSVDLFVGLKEGAFASFFPGPRCSLNFDEIFPPIHVTLHGVDVLIPANPFFYLEKVYGKTWRVPNRKFNHRWDKSTFADIM